MSIEVVPERVKDFDDFTRRIRLRKCEELTGKVEIEMKPFPIFGKIYRLYSQSGFFGYRCYYSVLRAGFGSQNILVYRQLEVKKLIKEIISGVGDDRDTSSVSKALMEANKKLALVKKQIPGIKLKKPKPPVSLCVTAADQEQTLKSARN